MPKNIEPPPINEDQLEELESRIAQYRDIIESMDPQQREKFQEVLHVIWCYHEFGIEGVVLTDLEIRSALHPRIISSPALIPHYDEVRAYYKGLQIIEKESSKKRMSVSMNLIKEIHNTVTITPDGRPLPYRKEMPLHRQYHHELTPPEKISYKMRKVGDWIQSTTFKKYHPLIKAAALHNKLMAIFPWSKGSGPVARLVANMVLLHGGYPPLIIPAVERQVYYEELSKDVEQDTHLHMAHFFFSTVDNYLESVFKRFGR